jgi:hypothetical protein
MPCGPQLIEAVASQLHADDGKRPSDIMLELLNIYPTSGRSIRYAIAELIKQGRAKRKGQQGPVYAVREESNGTTG